MSNFRIFEISGDNQFFVVIKIRSLLKVTEFFEVLGKRCGQLTNNTKYF